MRLDSSCYRIKVVVEYILLLRYTVCTTWFADDNIDEIRIKEVKYKKESLNTPPPHHLPTYHQPPPDILIYLSTTTTTIYQLHTEGQRCESAEGNYIYIFIFFKKRLVHRKKTCLCMAVLWLSELVLIEMCWC
jgi:hypothetical protein